MLTTMHCGGVCIRVPVPPLPSLPFPPSQYKLAGWLSVYCALMLLANCKAKDEKKSVFTLFL